MNQRIDLGSLDPEEAGEEVAEAMESIGYETSVYEVTHDNISGFFYDEVGLDASGILELDGTGEFYLDVMLNEDGYDTGRRLDVLINSPPNVRSSHEQYFRDDLQSVMPQESDEIEIEEIEGVQEGFRYTLDP